MGIYAGGGYGNRSPEKHVIGMIYAGGGYGSRSPEKHVMGMRPWGYMQGEAMEVEVLRQAVMGRRPWGYTQEEARRREGRRKEKEMGLSFEIQQPLTTRWGMTTTPEPILHDFGEQTQSLQIFEDVAGFVCYEQKVQRVITREWQKVKTGR